MGRDFSFIAGDDDDDDSFGEDVPCSRHNNYIGHIESVFFSKTDIVYKLVDLIAILKDFDYTDIEDVAEAINVFSHVLKETAENGATISYC